MRGKRRRTGKNSRRQLKSTWCAQCESARHLSQQRPIECDLPSKNKGKEAEHVQTLAEMTPKGRWVIRVRRAHGQDDFMKAKRILYQIWRLRTECTGAGCKEASTDSTADAELFVPVRQSKVFLRAGRHLVNRKGKPKQTNKKKHSGKKKGRYRVETVLQLVPGTVRENRESKRQSSLSA